SHLHFEIRRQSHPAHRPAVFRENGRAFRRWRHLADGLFCENTSEEIVRARYVDPIEFIQSREKVTVAHWGNTLRGLAWEPADEVCSRAKTKYEVFFNSRGKAYLYRTDALPFASCGKWQVPRDCSAQNPSLCRRDDAPGDFRFSVIEGTDRKGLLSPKLPPSLREFLSEETTEEERGIIDPLGPWTYLVLTEKGDETEALVIPLMPERGLPSKPWSGLPANGTREYYAEEKKYRSLWEQFHLAIYRLRVKAALFPEDVLSRFRAAWTVEDSLIKDRPLGEYYLCRTAAGEKITLFSHREYASTPYCLEKLRAAAAEREVYERIKAELGFSEDRVEGERGQDGQPGEPGQPGRPGRPGRDGKDGADGRDGRGGLSYGEAAP
ncbi:MAG TPA: collagen-like protein, partial [Candidatus Moranbacteria bacterium]|nr:collagen-like protein [Candidatus Moranbacteria bacterium]